MEALLVSYVQEEEPEQQEKFNDYITKQFLGEGQDLYEQERQMQLFRKAIKTFQDKEPLGKTYK